VTDRDQSTAQRLRDDFDRSFAEPAAAKPAMVSLLFLRVGGDPYALRLSEVAGIHRDKTIATAASTIPDLLGMAGFRGVIAPVYDLGILLGYPRARAPRWIALAQGPSPIALAFETFEAHFQVEVDRLASEGSSSKRLYLAGALHEANGTRALIHVASVVEALLVRARSSGPEKER
jgi:purine-binding chemotaxis protein CheW